MTPDATAEEIRNAYLARTRIIHPDRFDRQRQPQDWSKANEMLAELNEAYSVLRNQSSRAQYDNSCVGKQQHQSPPPPRQQQKPEPPSSMVFKIGELTAGQATFGSLPKNVQARLLQRQQSTGEDQFRLQLSSVFGNYFFIVVLLCWYCYLFVYADGAKWKNETLFWYSGVTLVVGYLVGCNCISILRYSKAILKPYFYVTPIYFVKTELDIVSFRPIWTLKDIAITHNYKNGSYVNSDVILKFEGYNESLTLSSKEQVETLLYRIRTYDTRLRTAYTNRDQEFFLNNDDFHGVLRAGVPATLLLSKGKQVLVYVTSIFLCGIGLIIAVTVNEDFSKKRWVRHPTPTANTMTLDQAYEEEFGVKHPTPTAYAPQSASLRGKNPSYPVQALPNSGAVRTWKSEKRIAPFEIKAAKGNHYLLKLVDSSTDVPVMTVFVRGGTTVEVKVPLGTYEVRYASGETWYGYEFLFGPDTSYSKADKAFTFKVVDNQISGFTITLYKVAHGNLRTSTIKPTEF